MRSLDFTLLVHRYILRVSNSEVSMFENNQTFHMAVVGLVAYITSHLRIFLIFKCCNKSMLITTVTYMLVIFNVLDVKLGSLIWHHTLDHMSKRLFLFQALFIKASIHNEVAVARGLTLI